MPVSWWGMTMGSVKSVLASVYIAAAVIVTFVGSAQALPVISSTITGTIRDNPRGGPAETVFSPVLSVFKQLIQEDRGIVKFDISGLTSPVGQALFDLTQIGSAGDGFQINVFGYRSNGTLELDDFPLGAFLTGFTVPAGAGSAISVDVTGFINDQIAINSNFVGFNLRLPTTTIVTNPLGFISGTGASSPTLTINDVQVISEPGTLAILGLGLLGLGFAGRRSAR